MPAAPLITAEMLATPSTGSNAQPGAANGGDDGLAAASFAALLHIANFVADAPTQPIVVDTVIEPAEQDALAPAQAEVPMAPAVENLLFLSSVLPPAAPTQAVPTAAPAKLRESTPIASAESLVADMPGILKPAEGLVALAAPPAALPHAVPAEPPQATVATRFATMIDARAIADPKAPAAESSMAVPAVHETPRITEATVQRAAAAKASAPSLAVVMTPAPALSNSAAAATPSFAIETPAFAPGWHEEAAHRIVALTVRGVERAELRLSPAELGPVELRIDVRGGEASLAIVATNPATRDALEQALPALRDMLAQQSIVLGEASVRDGRAEDAPARNDAPRGERASRETGTDDRESIAATVARIPRLIDVFA